MKEKIIKILERIQLEKVKNKPSGADRNAGYYFSTGYFEGFKAGIDTGLKFAEDMLVNLIENQEIK